MYSSAEAFFQSFASNIVGHDATFVSPYGTMPIVYADWIASGRLYEPIEQKMFTDFGQFVANTHTETNITGTKMTMAYHKAKEIIKEHVNANKNDVLIAYGSGMTGVINKFQRILGLKMPANAKQALNIAEEDRPIVFVTHMEHHSNHTSWIETICDVVKINPDEKGLVDMKDLHIQIAKYKNRKLKIAAITACSNVTGIQTPYHSIASVMHAHGGFCFVDFACSAPYIDIDMHPEKESERLDAIYFSAHKFLGGPGTPGIVIFNKELYANDVPDNPGGGTVKWTNAWNEHEYIDSIEDREDGGTPPFLQTIKAALCIKLKEKMSPSLIQFREEEMIKMVFEKLGKVENIFILAGDIQDRIGAISFEIKGAHYNLVVKLLNDKFGIQVRGGCSCAGAYGHYLFGIGRERSGEITDQINNGVFCDKPGWIRLSLHPTMSNDTVEYIINGIQQVAIHHAEWAKDYIYNATTNEFNYSLPFDDGVAQWMADAYDLDLVIKEGERIYYNV
jgi:selenocysteine lyase/cysteine desulfurase